MQTTTRRGDRNWRRRLCAGSGLVTLSLALAAAAAPLTAGAASNSQFGVANGDVAAITGTSMEVQNQTTGQTTVNWSTATTFTQIVSETLTNVTVGECVTVSGTASKKSKTTIAARTISIQPAPSSGKCTGIGGLGGRGGFRTSGGNGAGPGPGGGGRFFANGGPGGKAGSGTSGPARRFAGAGNFSFASGKVTAVSGTTLSVSGIIAGSFTRPRQTSSKNKRPPAPKTQKLKVTTSKSTTLSETQTTTSSSLAVGDCVTAVGTASSTGAVAASRVSITSKGGSSTSCTFGGGVFLGGGGPPGGPGPGAGA